jgi:hypothetical protein
VQDIAVMKTGSIQLTLALLIVPGVLLESAHAQWSHRRVQYRYNNARPAPPTNQVGKPTQPAEKPVKFKDLPLNSEFYFLADKDRKLFPRVKISNTAAKNVPTRGTPAVTTNAVPGDALVILKKEEPKKDGDKKEQPAKEDQGKR